MPRMPRIDIENALYYITTGGDHNEDIFKEEGDYSTYLDLLKRCKDQYEFKLFAFCLLPNQAHLLIEPTGDTTISQIMHRVNPNYTKYFNAKYDKKGHLFQERYKVVLAEKEPNLLDLASLIHLQPKILNLSYRIIDHSHSSYPSYLYYSDGKGIKDSSINMTQEIGEVLGYLKELTYRDFIDRIPSGAMAKLEEELAGKPIIGSDDFIKHVKAKIGGEKQKIEKAPLEKPKKIFPVKLTLIIESIAIIFLILLVFFFYLKGAVTREEEKKIAAKLGEVEHKFHQELDEKTRANESTYQQLSNELEAEREKVDRLNKRIRTLKHKRTFPSQANP